MTGKRKGVQQISIDISFNWFQIKVRWKALRRKRVPCSRSALIVFYIDRSWRFIEIALTTFNISVLRWESDNVLFFNISKFYSHTGFSIDVIIDIILNSKWKPNLEGIVNISFKNTPMISSSTMAYKYIYILLPSSGQISKHIFSVY